MKTYILQHNTFTHNKGDKFILSPGTLVHESSGFIYPTEHIRDFPYWFKEETPTETMYTRAEMTQFAARCIDQYIATREIAVYEELEKFINRC
jgi:hypothetical protein